MRRDYYANHRQAILAKARIRYIHKKEEIKAKERDRYIANREKIKLRQREYARTHCQQNRERAAEWRLANRAAHLERKRLYHHANRLRILEQKKTYREKHRVELRRKALDYHRRNPEVLLQSSSKRRALIRGCQINPAGIKQWMRAMRSRPAVQCYWCGRKIRGGQIHFDHVFPISKGGAHSISNLCIACQWCNSSKHDRTPSGWKCHAQLFLAV